MKRGNEVENKNVLNWILKRIHFIRYYLTHIKRFRNISLNFILVRLHLLRSSILDYKIDKQQIQLLQQNKYLKERQTKITVGNQPIEKRINN